MDDTKFDTGIGRKDKSKILEAEELRKTEVTFEEDMDIKDLVFAINCLVKGVDLMGKQICQKLEQISRKIR